MSFEKNHEIYADCLGATPAVEIFSIEDQKNRLVTANNSFIDPVKNALSVATYWLPAAAEELQISPNPKDYVLAPVVIMTNDLPNRNQIGFPYEELTRFNVDQGDIAYRTFNRKPTYTEHQNKDPVKSKGVVFDVAFRPMKNAKNIWLLITLCGFDRTKNPTLCNKILSEDNAYSMGAWATGYRCSVCSHMYHKKDNKVIECEHLVLNKPKFNIHANNKLSYYEAIGITGFEVSHVSSGAYPSATTLKDWIINNL